MVRITATLIALIFFAFFIARPTFAAQNTTVEIGRDLNALNGTIPGRTGNDCLLDPVQYRIEVQASDPGNPLPQYIFLRSKQNVDLYIRFGERVRVEDGRVIADYVSSSPSGIEDFKLPGEHPGTYFAAVSNCSETEAEYSISFSTLGDPPETPIVTGCKLARDPLGEYSLTILGLSFREGVIVTINNLAPKKIKLKKQSFSGYTKIVATGKVCKNLPGIIRVANPASFTSTPFMCYQRCLD